MGEMMFDMMNGRFQFHAVFLLERGLDRGGTADVLYLLGDQFRMRSMRQNEMQAPPIVHARLAVDRDMIDIAPAQPAFMQTVIERVGRQPGPMLDPAKTFFLRRGDNFSIDNQTRGGIGVISVETENCH